MLFPFCRKRCPVYNSTLFSQEWRARQQPAADNATQLAAQLLILQPACTQFKLADGIRFFQNKLKDNCSMDISFPQGIILSKNQKAQPTD